MKRPSRRSVIKPAPASSFRWNDSVAGASVELQSDGAGREARRREFDQQTEDGQARFLGQRGECVYRMSGVVRP